MWQAVWNWNDHNQGHGIALHADECDTYSSSDPITSFFFGHGGVLTLSDRKAAGPSKMLFQEDGGALVMAGEFQSEFWHGVTERASWSILRSRSMFDEMQVWEQRGLVAEIKRHKKAVDGEQHVRKNCTIRWHATHWENCPSQCHGNQVHSEVAVRKSDAAEAAGSSEMAVPTIQLAPSPCLTPSASLSTPVLMRLMRKPAALRMLSFLLLNISRRFNRGVL